MAFVSVAGSVSACATAAAYQLYKGGKGAIVVSLISGSVASSLALAISLGASAFEFAIARSAFMAIASMLLTLPIVIHTATLCPEGSEGTTYSIVMSWMNLTAILSESIEGLVTSAMGITDDNLSAMSYFCSVALMMSIVPFVFLKILPM